MKLALLVLAVAAPAAFSQTIGAVPALGRGEAKAPPSCQPARELETSFALTAPDGALIPLSYAGCSEEGRNDYLSGYTERYYTGTKGYALTLVTNHGDGAYTSPDETRTSEAFVSKSGSIVARLGTVDNAALVSGRAVSGQGYALRAGAVPSTAACEARLPKPVYGPMQLWLLTDAKAFYYHEDCDICAELDSCDLATGALKAERVAHSVSCSDLAKYRRGARVYFDACVPPGR